MNRILLFIGFLLFTTIAYGQDALVHINAEFNKSNDWYGLEAVEGVQVYSGYLESNKDMQKRYNITKVPTLILYKDGEEIYRWEGALDMKIHAKLNEIQNIIDERY